MKNKTLFFLLVCSVHLTTIFGQDKQPVKPVNISYQKNSSNDTVWLSVNADSLTKAGTLMLVTTVSTSIKTDTAFFPIIQTSSEFYLIIPEEYRTGVLSIKGFFYPKIFQVSGKVLEKIKNKKIKVLLITANQKLYNKELKLTADNEFALPELVFNNKARLVFNYISDKRTDHPDVRIEQSPIAANFTDAVFAAIIPLAVPPTPATGDVPVKNAPVNYSTIPSKDSADKFKIMRSVTVVGKRKTNAEKFNEQYTTPMFRDVNEKVIDCIDNENILSYPDCLSYLRGHIAGITPYIDKFGDNSLMWRGHETKAFFIDEIPVDIDELLSVNVADIAIIKAFPPPFLGSSGNGDGGAIAIYTKQGEFRNSKSGPNKWLFSIKGYAPALHTLFSDK